MNSRSTTAAFCVVLLVVTGSVFASPRSRAICPNLPGVKPWKAIHLDVVTCARAGGEALALEAIDGYKTVALCLTGIHSTTTFKRLDLSIPITSDGPHSLKSKPIGFGFPSGAEAGFRLLGNLGPSATLSDISGGAHPVVGLVYLVPKDAKRVHLSSRLYFTPEGIETDSLPIEQIGVLTPSNHVQDHSVAGVLSPPTRNGLWRLPEPESVTEVSSSAGKRVGTFWEMLELLGGYFLVAGLIIGFLETWGGGGRASRVSPGGPLSVLAFVIGGALLLVGGLQSVLLLVLAALGVGLIGLVGVVAVLE